MEHQLPVDGEARVIIQDATAYQKLLKEVEASRAEHVIRKRLASLEQGESGVPAARVLTDVRKRFGKKNVEFKKGIKS